LSLGIKVEELDMTATASKLDLCNTGLSNESFKCSLSTNQWMISHRILASELSIKIKAR